MAIMGSFGFGIMEIHLVTSLLMDSQVFQSVAFAYLKGFRCYHFRNSIRPFQSPCSSTMASDYASPRMPRRKICCLLAWSN